MASAPPDPHPDSPPDDEPDEAPDQIAPDEREGTDDIERSAA